MKRSGPRRRQKPSRKTRRPRRLRRSADAFLTPTTVRRVAPKGAALPIPAGRGLRAADLVRYSRRMATYDETTALVVVDVQNDFSDPAGSLSVRDGDAIVPLVNDEVRRARA